MNFKNYFQEIFEKNTKQDSVIDAVRAMSVLSIIAFHVTVGIIQVFDFEKSKQYILNMPNFLQPLWHGEKGVDAFFLISALVLGIPLFKKLDQFDFSAAKNFYRKRFFRIYPLFLIALILYTIAQWSYFGQYFFTNLFLINNLIEGQRTIIPVGWSLLVEVQYYALLPFLFLALKKFKYNKSILLGLLAASFLACAYKLLNNPELYERPLTDLFLAEDRALFTKKMGDLLYESNMTRFGPFAVGLLLAYLRVNNDAALSKLFKVRTLSTCATGVSLFCLAYGLLIPTYDPTSIYYQYFSAQLNFLLLISQRQIFALGLMILILGCWYSPQAQFVFFRNVFEFRIWKPFSRLSFPIYLFHFPFVAIAAIAVFGTTDVKTIFDVSFWQGCSIFLLATVLTTLFSIPLYIYVERPFIEIGKSQQN